MGVDVDEPWSEYATSRIDSLGGIKGGLSGGGD